MSKNQYTLLVFSIIGILLLIPGYGVHFFEQIWNFPGNLFSDDFKKSINDNKINICLWWNNSIKYDEIINMLSTV